ncbi:hypothetical protein J1N35_008398 [Gossypium stocksii]|uniref:Putative plant transposon protein domain-containing protein n=1 Tax=Gossypium stocksii TaxID=47602 RepID=A0A9D4AGG2_9ROSI|nr:hypothetical protein J1N35_008398 [Gossypium stocksii]
MNVEDIFGKVVFEFHAHVNSPDSPFIYVCGSSFPFNEDHINAQFGIANVQDEHTPFTDNVTADGLTQVLNDLCVEGMYWIVSNQDCYTVERASLKPIRKVWYHFLKSWFKPSTHNMIVSKERMLLLHSIIMGRRINIG